MGDFEEEILRYLEKKRKQWFFRSASMANIRTHLQKTFHDPSIDDDDVKLAMFELYKGHYVNENLDSFSITVPGMGYLVEPKKKPIQNQKNWTLIVLSVVLILTCGVLYSKMNEPQNLKQTNYQSFQGATNSSGNQKVAQPTVQAPPKSHFRIPGLKEAVDDSKKKAAETQKLGDWLDSFENITTFGVPFILTPDSPVLETESQYIKNGARLRIPVDAQAVVRVHLIINLDYTSPKWLENKVVEGNVVGRLRFVFKDGQSFSKDLIAGKDIRDWFLDTPQAVGKVGNAVKTVWVGSAHGSNNEAVMSYIAIDIPSQMQSSVLSDIVIEDLSQETIKHQNPGIVLFGVAVELKQ